MRRHSGKINGEQYLVNTDPGKKEVHDLDMETVECRIEEIITASSAAPFESEVAANSAGYNNCPYCIG